jgi:proliferating cell nuclear antigen
LLKSFIESEKISDFNLNLLTIDSEQLSIPETEYSSIVTMSSAEFTRICREMSQISETVTIETSKESIKFSVNGEIGGGSVTIKGNESDKKEEQTTLEVDEPVSLSFALRYLNLFNKASNLSNQVVLSMSTDTPLVVEYRIPDLGSLRFYLAPKITEDEAA